MHPEDVRKEVIKKPELPFVYSDATYRVIEQILRNKDVGRILDFRAIPQSFVFYLSEILKPEVVHANSQDDELIKAALSGSFIRGKKQPNYCRTSNVQWMELDASFDSMRYDVVFGALEKQEHLRAALQYLRKDGIGIFHVDTGFFRVRSQNDEYAIMKRKIHFGNEEFFIESALTIPTSFLVVSRRHYDWYPDEYIIIVTRREVPDIFVAEVFRDMRKNMTVLRNMKARKNGSTLRYGLLTDVEYLSYDEFKYVDEALSMVYKDGSLSEYEPLSEVVQDITFLENTESSIDVDSIFVDLPKDEFTEKKSIRILVDSRRVLASFLNLFLEATQHHREDFIITMQGTMFGRGMYRKWLDGCTSETHVKHRILNTLIPLPPLPIQHEIVSLVSDIQDLRSHLQLMKKRVWSSPLQVDEIGREYEAFGDINTLDSWIRVLPYPLASILWRYHAISDDRTKVESLFHFFEATAQFLSTILLSGLTSDTEFYEKYHSNWINITEYRNTFSKATMGNWVYLGIDMSSFLRDFVNEKEGLNKVKKLFSNPSPQALEALVNANLWRIMKEALDLRNTWKGHSGISGRRELEKRREILEGLLSRLRTVLSDNLQSMRLVLRKEEIAYIEGIHKYRIRALEGAKMPLPEEKVKVNSAMKTGSIYIIQQGQKQPIEVLPFVQIRKDRETGSEGCYFYNRIEDSSCRFISYDCEEKPEMFLDCTEVSRSLRFLGTDVIS